MARVTCELGVTSRPDGSLSPIPLPPYPNRNPPHLLHPKQPTTLHLQPCPSLCSTRVPGDQRWPPALSDSGWWGNAVADSQPRVAWPYKGRSQEGLLAQAWRENPDSHCLFSPSQPPESFQTEDRGSPSGQATFPEDSGEQGGKTSPSSGSSTPGCGQAAPGKILPGKIVRPPAQLPPLTEGETGRQREALVRRDHTTWVSQVGPIS